MRQATILEVDRVLNVIQRRCDSQGVTLTWSTTALTAMTDGHNITLPAIKQPVTKEAMEKLYGFVIHETGHHTRSEAFDILKAAKPSRALAAIYNIVEDDGMERDIASRYRGDAKGLGIANNIIIKDVAGGWKGQVDEWEQRNPNEEITEVDMAPAAACAIGQLSRITWDSWSNDGRARYLNDMHPVATKLLDTLVSEGWVKKFKETVNEHDTWDVAVDLFKRLFPQQDDDATEQQRKDGHGMDPSDSEDGAGECEEGEGKDADGKPDDTVAKGKPDDEGRVISWQDAVLSEHEWQPKPDDVQPGNVGIDWKDYTTGEVKLMPPAMINVIDCRNHSAAVTKDGWADARPGYDGSPESFLSDNKQARIFANRIRRYIQAQARMKIETEQYSGRLDKRSLVKLALPPIDGGEYNKRLFYTMSKRRSLNTAVHILTDWSGSMQGQKMIHAADASGRLVHTFDRVLRIPVQLAAFTNGRSRCDIGLIKAFRDRSVSPLDVATGFSRFYPFSSANNDADAVMWAYRQLMKRTEDRRILIVLSDGCPAGSWGTGNSASNLAYVTNYIEKQGDIELYGVGICSDAVTKYYSNTKVLANSDEINRTLFEIIKGGTK